MDIQWHQLTYKQRDMLGALSDSAGASLRDLYMLFDEYSESTIVSTLTSLSDIGLIDSHIDSLLTTRWKRTDAGRALVEAQRPATHTDTEYTYDAPAETLDTLRAENARLRAALLEIETITNQYASQNFNVPLPVLSIRQIASAILKGDGE